VSRLGQVFFRRASAAESAAIGAVGRGRTAHLDVPILGDGVRRRIGTLAGSPVAGAPVTVGKRAEVRDETIGGGPVAAGGIASRLSAPGRPGRSLSGSPLPTLPR
jgi:hypothetical protein